MRIGTDDNKLSGDVTHLEIAASGSTQEEVAGKVVVTLPGGGSQGLVPVLVPLAFDTAGLTMQRFNITAVDQGAQKLTIAGNHTALFPVSALLNVFGSTGNDGEYTIATVTFTGGNTVIVTVGALPDDTVDGQIGNGGTAGIVVYTPNPGDRLIQGSGQLSVTTAWDSGESPSLYLTGQGSGLSNNYIDTQSLSNVDAALPYGATPYDRSWPGAGVLLDGTPLVLAAYDGPTGSTVGAATSLFFIAPVA